MVIVSILNVRNNIDTYVGNKYEELKMPTPSMKPRKREAAAVDVRTTIGWVLRTKGAVKE